ncbi:putative sporulation protein YtaF [Moorella humiferrea]|uniref:sporulation membrane protein YtaF n=1 Tax=Neomoorella humiferrea TaxID=676965 RepID=UPI0030D50346
MLMATLLLAFAASLDGLGVGLSYGLRSIKLPWYSLFIIALVSLTVSFSAMVGGHFIVKVFSPALAGHVGAVILLTLGLALVLEAYCKEGIPEKAVVKLRLPRLGLVIQNLKEPVKADADSSGSIGGREAFTLGLALALDSMGIGFGAAAAGFSFLLTPLLLGGSQVLLILVGLCLGRRWRPVKVGWRGAALPGLILIAIGIWRW